MTDSMNLPPVTADETFSRRAFVAGVVTVAATAGAAGAAQAQGGPTVNFINPPTMAKPPGYTHVIEVIGPGRTIYIAGQLGLDKDGKTAGGPGDFRAQAMQAFENVKNALASVGGTFDNVVKLNNYIVDIAANIPIYREVRDLYLSKDKPPPASTTIEVPKLARPGLVFEVEAIAILPPK